MVNGIVLILSIAAAISLLLTLIAPHIDPSVSWIFPILGLVAPAIYIANVILALYWVICWRWYSIPMIALLICGVNNISLFVNMEISKDYGLDDYRNMPKVMSYNVRQFFNDDKQWSTEEVALYVEEQNPDIICFQEYNTGAKRLTEDMRDRLNKYSRAEFKTLAIYSRYPIIKKENIFTKDSNESWRAMWVDLVIREDTIRVFNNHLHSTTINAKDDEYITSRQIVQDTLRSDKIQDMLLRFRNSSMERNRQVDTIAQVITQSPHPVVVCGDFNDTPMSHTYNIMSRGLKDAFQQSGKGYSYTYRGFYNTLRIDYILVSEGITTHNYQVDEECTISDHLPIMTHIEINKHK